MICQATHANNQATDANNQATDANNQATHANNYTCIIKDDALCTSLHHHLAPHAHMQLPIFHAT